MRHDEPDRDRCGIGRCKSSSDMLGNGVPMCREHWETCCKTGLTTTKWLQDKARAEWQSSIIDMTLREPKAPRRVARLLDRPRRLAVRRG